MVALDSEKIEISDFQIIINSINNDNYVITHVNIRGVDANLEKHIFILRG